MFVLLTREEWDALLARVTALEKWAKDSNTESEDYPKITQRMFTAYSDPDKSNYTVTRLEWGDKAIKYTCDCKSFLYSPSQTDYGAPLVKRCKHINEWAPTIDGPMWSLYSVR